MSNAVPRCAEDVSDNFGTAAIRAARSRTSPRVALLQSTVGFDGRSQTLAAVIRIFNRRGIQPTLLTFSDGDDVERMRANASDPFKLDLVTLARPQRARGHQFEQILLPRVARKSLEDFDVVYASDTGVYGFDPAKVVLRLVCFPIECVPQFEDRYRRPAYRTYAALGRATTRAARKKFRPHGIWIANSEFTKQVMLSAYSLADADVHVVYPPVEIPAALAEPKRESFVVSIAGFHEDKRQLEQIELAAALPSAQFVLMGSRRSSGYFRRCERAAEHLPNVTLLADAPPRVIDENLQRAHVFLHSKRFEHFGMSTVEGIGYGCVPVVHDSGGQREVVPLPELRYATTNDAIGVLERALAGQFDAYRSRLRNHIEAYTVRAFVSRMEDLVDCALSKARY